MPTPSDENASPARAHIPPLHFAKRHPLALPNLLLALAGLLLLVGCIDGAFTTYDDIQHMKIVADAIGAGPVGFLKPIPAWSYMPITMLTYQLDRAVFSELLHIENWAVGVRAMNWIYHTCAALVLLRVILLLGLSRTQAFFVALVFALHPMACETVAWISERKNALAAMFGFLALWVWLGWGTDFGRGRSRRWRIPAAALLYLMALLSKPSALGLLPVFGLLELFPPGEPRDPWPARLLKGALSCLPLAILAAGFAVLNIRTHGPELVTPPGGSIYTALLTDLEILTRYLSNLIAPVKLSAFYFVAPILSLTDPRVWQYGLILAALAAVSIYLSANRTRAILCWGWFIGALGPNLNIVAIPLYMQDRYAYLSTPAIFILLVDVIDGLRTRLKLTPVTLKIVSATFVSMLAVLAVQRSFVWYNALTIFSDAVAKQPKSANARYALGMAYAQAAEAENRNGHVQMSQQFTHDAALQWKAALDESPDAGRFAFFEEMAWRVGKEFADVNDAATSEKYLRLAAYPPKGVPPFAPMSEQALRDLIDLITSKGRFEEGLVHAIQLVQRYSASDANVLIRARAAYLLAENCQQKGNKNDAATFINAARADLNVIDRSSPQFQAAQQFLLQLDKIEKQN